MSNVATKTRVRCVYCRSNNHKECTTRGCTCECRDAANGGPPLDVVKAEAEAEAEAEARRQALVRLQTLGAVPVDELPGRPPGKIQWFPNDLIDAMRQLPGQWVQIRTYKYGSGGQQGAARLKKGPPPGKWEFAGRRTLEGSATFARYVGPAD